MVIYDLEKIRKSLDFAVGIHFIKNGMNFPYSVVKLQENMGKVIDDEMLYVEVRYSLPNFLKNKISCYYLRIGIMQMMASCTDSDDNDGDKDDNDDMVTALIIIMVMRRRL